jgi:hypothetical protein
LKRLIQATAPNCSRSERGSAATSSPMILVTPSSVELRHVKPQAGATGTAGLFTFRPSPAEASVAHGSLRPSSGIGLSKQWLKV